MSRVKVYDRIRSVHLPQAAAALGQRRLCDFNSECVHILAVATSKKAIAAMMAEHTDTVDPRAMSDMQVATDRNLTVRALRESGFDLSAPGLYAYGNGLVVRLDASGMIVPVALSARSTYAADGTLLPVYETL